ncbi:MAG: hypothetical protein HY897_21270 [Deltaproteobacteria bacterium]|nr:hypothetical protein [Deltaproteobacteria bacterium]
MKYLFCIVVAVLLAAGGFGCKTISGEPDEGAVQGAPGLDPEKEREKVEHIEQKVEDIKKKKDDAEKRVKELEKDVKKGP